MLGRNIGLSSKINNYIKNEIKTSPLVYFCHHSSMGLFVLPDTRTVSLTHSISPPPSRGVILLTFVVIFPVERDKISLCILLTLFLGQVSVGVMVAETRPVLVSLATNWKRSTAYPMLLNQRDTLQLIQNIHQI